ncbi:MAG: TatD family hydrolase [Actinobacteria bacterium]|nr:TatD family hydrolase [Actinomycetota bacterium]
MSRADVDHVALAAAGPWIDTHCHLSLDDAHPADPDIDIDTGVVEADVDATLAAAGPVIAAARANGVERLITIGTDVASSRSGAAVAGVHENVWATVGLHPHDASRGVDSLEAVAASPKVVAIGECGLDYHYEHSPRAAQREAFAAQIDLAKRLDLALVVHTREAWDDTFDLFAAEGVPDRTIIHCFTGGPDEARRCLDLGAHVSFSGIVTFKNAPEVRAAAALCPADRLLVETDSPFLAPVPYRGESNRPEWVPMVGAAVAEVRNETVRELAASVWANAESVFRIG